MPSSGHDETVEANDLAMRRWRRAAELSALPYLGRWTERSSTHRIIYRMRMIDPEPLPDDYEPSHVFRVVAMPIERGWGVWLRAADDSIIDSFGIGLPPETTFMPEVLDALGPLLRDRYRLAYQGADAWDQLDNHWSAIVYALTSDDATS